MNVIIYTTPTCPRCKQLIAALEARGHTVKRQDLREAQNMTYLRISGVFVVAAPVLEVRDEFYTVADLWEDGKLRDLTELGL